METCPQMASLADGSAYKWSGNGLGLFTADLCQYASTFTHEGVLAKLPVVHVDSGKLELN